MKKLLLLFAVVSFAASCTKHDELLESAKSGANVEFTISSEADVEVMTRAVDEYEVRNFHLFLFGENNGRKYHFDQFVPKLEMKIEAGEYEVYAVANHDGVHEDLTAGQLKNLQFDFHHSPALETLPMSYEGTLTVPATGKITSNIYLIRSVAKLMINISNGQNNGIQIISAKVYNIPVKGNLFDKYELTILDAEDYISEDITDRLVFKDDGKGYGYGVYSTFVYMPENRRGVNPAIPDQYNKNKENAPENATYMHVKAKWRNSGWDIYDYYVYLGENNTTDFNIRRNSRLNYTMRLSRGSNSADTRVQKYYLYYDWMFGNGLSIGDNKFTTSHSLEFRSQVSSSDPDVRVHIKYEFNPMQPDGLLIDYKKPASMIIEDTYAPGDYATFIYQYRPLDYYHSGNDKVYLTISCTDNRGYSFVEHREYTYFNYSIVHVRRDTKEGQTSVRPGVLEIEGAERYYMSDNVNYDSWWVYYGGEGCTLKANPEPGYKFIGWYMDDTYSVILSNKTEYLYNPQKATSTIAAKFEPI